MCSAYCTACIACVCSAYCKPMYGTESIHEPEFCQALYHQTHFPRSYHSTYTFVKLLFILRHLASIWPALNDDDDDDDDDVDK